MTKDLIEVRVKLKPQQQYKLNIWYCTIDNVVREVTSQTVVFYVQSFENLAQSFKLEECAEVHTKWINTNFGIDGHGNPLYYG
jgi:hypothetical protein